MNKITNTFRPGLRYRIGTAIKDSGERRHIPALKRIGYLLRGRIAS